MFELRLVVEPQAAEMAALRRDDRQLTDMANALETMERCTLATDKGRAADIRFHELVLEATRNELMQALSTSISTAIASTTAIKSRVQDSPRDPMPEHHALYRCIAEGNAKQARKAMVALIDLAHSDTRVALRREGGGFDRVDSGASHPINNSIRYSIGVSGDEGQSARMDDGRGGAGHQLYPSQGLRGCHRTQASDQGEALPLTDVRLTASDYATAVEVNVDYLMSLSPDRFLHNFRKYAGLEPKAPIYGGWNRTPSPVIPSATT